MINGYTMEDVRNALLDMDSEDYEFFHDLWCADTYGAYRSDEQPCPYAMMGGAPRICPLPGYCRCCPYNWIDERGRLHVQVDDALHRAEPDSEPGPMERLVMAMADRADGMGRLEAELDRLNMNLENE